MGNYKKILVLNNEVEAMLMDSILREKNIPHVLRSYSDLVYDGIFQTQKGWGHIESKEEYREEIMEVYKDIVDN
jgi:hypothetical protein